MEALNCCKSMEMELTGWKAIIYDIVRKMDKIPAGTKENFRANVEDMHMLVEELDQRIEDIRKNCSPETGIDDIRAEREKFSQNISDLRVKAEDAMKILGAGNFGG